MEVSVTYSACPLKPAKAKGDQKNGQSGRDKDLQFGLHGWKKVEVLRYRNAGSEDGAPLSMVAFGRDAKQARLYSLHHGAGSIDDSRKRKTASFKLLRRRQKEEGIVRKKTKITRAALLSLSESGQFAAVASVSESIIRVYDLSSRDHRLVLQVPFSESVSARSSSKGKIPAPQHLAVSNDGQRLVSESISNGTMWLYSRGKWSVLGTELEPLARSTAVRFQDFGVLKEPGIGESIAVSRAFARRQGGKANSLLLKKVCLRMEFSQLARRSKTQGVDSFTPLVNTSRSIVLALEQHATAPPEPGQVDGAVQNVLQCWAATGARTSSSSLMSTFVVNFAPQSKTLPVVVMHDPFSGGSATVARIGVAAALGSGVKCCDMSWTYDNAFLALVFSDGSLCLVASSGEPVRLVPPPGTSVRRRARVRLTFRHLEHYEEQGKVPSHFAVACHPQRPEVTWCDGNRNLVHVRLPTMDGIETRGLSKHSADRALRVQAHVTVALTTLGSANDLPSSSLPYLTQLHGFTARHKERGVSGYAARRAILGWAVCTSMPPLGWTRSERLAARVCARAIARASIQQAGHGHVGGGDQIGAVRIFAHALSSARRDFRSSAELAFATRILVAKLVDHQYFYAALHVLRLAEAHFRMPGSAANDSFAATPAPSVHLSACFDVTFDRFWLLLGASALCARSQLGEPALDRKTRTNSDRAIGLSALGYAQQRARTWAQVRADENLERAGDLRLSLGRRDGVVGVYHQVAPSWPGHDCFVRGKYDAAEDAYQKDNAGAFPLVCLVLRRYKVEHALQIAREWRALSSKQLAPKRPALGLLGKVLAGALLNRPDLVATPSPLANPTNRSVRFLDMARLADALAESSSLEVEIERLDAQDYLCLRPDVVKEPRLVFTAAFCLLLDGQSSLCVELLVACVDAASVAQLLAECPDMWHTLSEQDRAYVLQRHIAVLLSLGSSFASTLATVVARYEQGASVREKVLWVVLTQLDIAGPGQIATFSRLITSNDPRQGPAEPTSLHPLVALGRAALCIFRSGDCGASAKAHLFQAPISEWVALLQVFALIVWKGTGAKSARSAPPLTGYIRSRGAAPDGALVQTFLKKTCQQDDLFLQVADGVLSRDNLWPVIDRAAAERQESAALASSTPRERIRSPRAPLTPSSASPGTEAELAISDELSLRKTPQAKSPLRAQQSLADETAKSSPLVLPCSLLPVDDHADESGLDSRPTLASAASPSGASLSFSAADTVSTLILEKNSLDNSVPPQRDRRDERFDSRLGSDDSDDDDSGVEYESPWIFKSDKTGQGKTVSNTTTVIASAINDQNRKIDNALRRIEHRQEIWLNELESKISSLASSTVLQEDRPGSLEFLYQRDRFDDDDEYRADFLEQDDDEREVATSQAARRFLSFTANLVQPRHVQPPSLQGSAYESPIENDREARRQALLKRIVPTLRDTPALLQPHPAAIQTAQAHVMKRRPMTSPSASPALATAANGFGALTSPLSSPVVDAFAFPHGSPSVSSHHLPTRGAANDSGSHAGPPFSPGAPHAIPQPVHAEQCVAPSFPVNDLRPKVDAPNWKPTMMQRIHTNAGPASGPHIHVSDVHHFQSVPIIPNASSRPELYLSLQADGQRISYLTSNQHNMRHFVAVADIKPSDVQSWQTPNVRATFKPENKGKLKNHAQFLGQVAV